MKVTFKPVVTLEAISYHLMLTCSPAAQKISLMACRVDEVDSLLDVSDTSSNSADLESLPNTHAFIMGKQMPRPARQQKMRFKIHNEQDKGQKVKCPNSTPTKSDGQVSSVQQNSPDHN